MARIAYMLGKFPVLSETFIGNEMRAMEALGHEIIPIALHTPDADYQTEDKALADRTLYFSPISDVESGRLVRKYSSLLDRVYPFALAQTTELYYPLLVHAAHLAEYIRKKECVHIHAHFGWGAATYAIAAAKLLCLPVTFTCHGSDVYRRPLDIELKCQSATAVFGVAPTITADLQKLAPQTPCHTVYCGVDTERFRPLADLPGKHNRWLFVGRLIDCKGLDDILFAWQQMPPQSRPPLDIVGEGPMKEALESYVNAQGLKDRVSFLGPRPAQWIMENAPCYRAFISAFRTGSDGSRDTAPMVLKEAMAMALPIVTTDFVNIPELVGPRCAVICPVSSPDDLARAVMNVDDLPQEALQAMGRHGRVRVEQYYSLKQQATHITELFARYDK